MAAHVLRTQLKFFLFVSWLIFIFAFCVHLFASGFLLTRKILPFNAKCPKNTCENLSTTCENALNTTCENTSTTCNGVTEDKSKHFEKAVIVIVDALRHDFCVYDEKIANPPPFKNKLPAIRDAIEKGRGRLYEFVADPPTTTMQRLKGLTTGSLPTFIDVSSNFGSYEIDEDNIIDQMKARNKTVFFTGDDTWMGLFPKQFDHSVPFPSFDVWDLDTVDRGVSGQIRDLMENTDRWDVLIAHFLGVDHAGHKYGPNHPEMTRKLGEMNTEISFLIENLPHDCVLIVLGDHGMTGDGDHGGDSPDELNAGLFIYHKHFENVEKNLAHIENEKENFENTKVEILSRVEQIDLVPTLAFMLDFPIPFSNLGSVIPELIFKRPQLSEKFEAVNANLEQIVAYLKAYREKSGARLQEAQVDNFELKVKRFTLEQNKPLSEAKRSKVLANGLELLKEAKTICRSIWIEFDLNLIGLGLALFTIHMSLLTVTLLVPCSRAFADSVCWSTVVSIFRDHAVGLGVGVFFSFARIHSGPYLVTLLTPSVAFAVMGYGLNSVWKIRSKIVTLQRSFFGLFTEGFFPYGLSLAVVFLSAFSNSFVVDEAKVISVLVSAVAVWAAFQLKFDKRRKRSKKRDSLESNCEENEEEEKDDGGSFFLPVVALILFLGLVRLASVYFRCREEQSSCVASDYHKPIGTLPKFVGSNNQNTTDNQQQQDELMKSYKNWRFFYSVSSVALFTFAVHSWQKAGGNLNGFSMQVCAAIYAPTFILLSVICYWALQGHPVGATMDPWQRNFLAQAAFAVAALTLFILLAQPKLVYSLAAAKADLQFAELPRTGNGIVQKYFTHMKSHWKEHFTRVSVNNSQITVFGLGSSISAALLMFVTIVVQISTVISGDGHAPALILSLIATHILICIMTLNRLKTAESAHELVLRVPWSHLIVWSLMESFTFYATGHQATFNTIQWSAAFAGFSGANFGTGNGLLDFLLPAVLVGWNTFSSRIIFGISLPFLLLLPVMIWLRFPSVRQKNVPRDADVFNLKAEDLSKKGEAALLDIPTEFVSAVGVTCARYALLTALRLFAALFSATVLRRHLMVWKIFAPKMIFEAIGFGVSGASVIVGYLVICRILSVIGSHVKYLEVRKNK